MGAKRRLWWQKIRNFLPIIAIIAALVGVLILLVFAGYKFDWTGFNRYIGPQLQANQQYRPEKTLWDWLQLLIIPIVLAGGGYLLNLTLKRSEQETTTDNQRETALQAYIDKISELLLKEHLWESVSEIKPPDDDSKSLLKQILRRWSRNSQTHFELQSEDEVRTIARVRTLTVLSRLDPARKSSVLQFLHESGLIDKDKHVVDLNGANLSGASLSNAFLSNAFLSGADLSGTNLSWAFLVGADLSGADLSGANLSWADFTGADLSGANLSGADLRYANFSDADLNNADLRNANLSNTGFGGANLSFTFLSRPNLKNSSLDGADLRYANFRNASLKNSNLSNADLSGAKLNGADLSGANLSDAEITQEQWEKAKSLKHTTMPNGKVHP